MKKDRSLTEHVPTVRLHLWLDTDDGLFFGTGRALLLERIEKHGSLKKAAEELGMSYRAAWGKIKQSEKILGFELITRNSRRGGYELTDFGRLVRDRFVLWFNEVEKTALAKATEIFPWDVQGYRGNVAKEEEAAAGDVPDTGPAATADES
ncbi:LysR family transcriptional regulator [Desulfovibrio sulfodismutans]|uniref:LysR family transcriptional regulator n=1 Tax=Desulfolutivibrio sulfodismutans TaxID=63561 RepID=A0A7K3NQP3_9BACT|nr:LysR family transcriptional regulator [Desulfolutivibrio sulfodismutans]NDY58113.1 LysR family transcriptional regulator [Desulfolutivibrio sulfodismutans]QLA14089.1 LysR family transcriptional regulator [Desulfolutivibrio sulfodismutans DSM 3696]